MNRLSIFLIALLLAAMVVPVAAQDLYNNGPTDGQTRAWLINFGFAVSNQFPLNSSTSLFSLEFAAWLFPGDTLETAQVSITSSEFGATSYFDRTMSFTASNCFENQAGYNVCDETAYFGGGLPLNAGNYWLNLSNAVVNTGDPVWWDQNSGPSQASESSVGTIPSESFTIGGYGSPPPTSPEPGSWLLFGSGLAALLLAGWHRSL